MVSDTGPGLSSGRGAEFIVDLQEATVDRLDDQIDVIDDAAESPKTHADNTATVKKAITPKR